MTMAISRMTGTDNIPLGPSRRFGQDKPKHDSSMQLALVRPVRRQSRWSPKTNDDGLLDLPTALTSYMTPEQLEAYALNLRIKEITQNLRFNTVVPRHRERSPSPPPTYDNTGRRTNTRDVRYKKKLEDERHRLVEKAMKFIPEFKPPSDYRRHIKTQEKIYIPVNDYPEINFIGLLLGPRGKSLKEIEVKTQAKIFIRGKGSVKDGKKQKGDSNLEEDLHCLIMADTEEKITAAVETIQGIIETAASVPESQNERKINQLRDIAIINGTLRDDEGQPCQSCGKYGHRKYNCPNKEAFNANIKCRRCGQSGHIQRDCKATLQIQGIGTKEDQEYQNFMAELEGGKNSGIGYGHTATLTDTRASVPWRSQPAPPIYPPTAPASSASLAAPVPMSPFGQFPSLAPPPSLSSTFVHPWMPPTVNMVPPPPSGW
jgi:splicing factor 1